jgi:hypothetical protein
MRLNSGFSATSADNPDRYFLADDIIESGLAFFARKRFEAMWGEVCNGPNMNAFNSGRQSHVQTTG